MDTILELYMLTLQTLRSFKVHVTWDKIYSYSNLNKSVTYFHKQGTVALWVYSSNKKGFRSKKKKKNLFSLKNDRFCQDLNLGPTWYLADMLPIELS